MKKILHILLIISFLLSGACSKSIRKVQKNAVALSGKKVRVKGEVISSLSLINFRSFVLRKHGSTIWVLTNDLLPNVGEVVNVKGKVIPDYHYNKETIVAIDTRKGNFVFYERPIIKKYIKTPKKNEKPEN